MSEFDVITIVSKSFCNGNLWAYDRDGKFGTTFWSYLRESFGELLSDVATQSVRFHKGLQKETYCIETEMLHLVERMSFKITSNYQNRWSLEVQAAKNFALMKLADGFCQSCRLFVPDESDYFDLV